MIEELNKKGDDLYDVDRYDSAIGWEPDDRKAVARKQNKKTYIPLPPETMLYVTPCNDVFKYLDKDAEAAKLFGDLWIEGELAVMFGDASAGKSILGVQIADALARGCPIPPFDDRREKGTVLYVDLDMSHEQFARRYYDDKTKRTYDFAEDFFRAGNIWDGALPNDFKDPAHYIVYSIRKELDNARPHFLIIDNLTHLRSAALSNNTAAVSLMKALRIIRYDYDISILAIVNSKSSGKRGELKLKDLANKAIGDLADSVFAIGSSTYGDDIRYIKHLKSRSAPIARDGSRVNVYRIERFEKAEHETGTIDADASTWLSAPEFRLPNINAEPTEIVRAVAVSWAKELMSRAEANSKKIAPSGGPFIGFRHLGFSAESEHLRDHTEEIERLVFNEQIRRMSAAGVPPKMIQLILEDSPVLKRAAQTKPKNTTDILLSREYQNYLKR